MKWKEIFPNGSDVIYRHGHRAVVDGDFIYFYGGGNWKICTQLNAYHIKENLNFLPKYNGKICSGLACFGMVKLDDRIIVFGGMEEFGIYTNSLYTLNISTWTWKKHFHINKCVPKPRIGHSFTLTDENKIFMFGGLINADPKPNKVFTPKYMNDLYILHQADNEKFRWEKLPTAEKGPCGRESHSAIFHYDEKENVKFLIIFGGMNTNRLGDLWFLNVKELVWLQFEINGIPPSPRSLHTASLVSNKMYIFGGWVNRQPLKPNTEPPSVRFETTNTLSYLDLDELKWYHCDYNDDEICPMKRAGHSAVTVNSRIYVWGGRSCYADKENDDCITKDFWYLETQLPSKILNISLIKTTKTTLELDWDAIDNAECYIVEIHKIQAAPIDLSKIRIKTNLGADHKPVSIKRKFEELEITASKKFSADVEDIKLEIKSEAIKMEEAPKFDENMNKFEPIIDTQVKEESPIKSVSEVDKTWLTVGVYKSNSCIVDGFYTFKISTTNLNYQNCPEPKNLIPELKVHLTSNTMYAFRIAPINLLGIGEWSKMFYFKTADVEMPSMPNNCKFIPSNSGLRLAWNPNPFEEKINAYSVFIATNKNVVKNELSFLRIYEGKQPTCNVPQNYIDKAYQEKEGCDTVVIFRITAANSIGISPPLLTTYYF